MATTLFAVTSPFRRLMFSSVELLSAPRSPPVAIANRLSAPARPLTLTVGVRSLAIEPSPGSAATEDTTFAAGVLTARPTARAVGVCAHTAPRITHAREGHAILAIQFLGRTPRCTAAPAPSRCDVREATAR